MGFQTTLGPQASAGTGVIHATYTPEQQQLFDLMMQNLTNTSTGGTSSEQDFMDVDESLFSLDAPFEEIENNYFASQQAGMEQALRDFERGTPMGMSAGPYSQAYGGTTRDSIIQRNMAATGAGMADLQGQHAVMQAQQGLAATDLQRQVDLARSQAAYQDALAQAALMNAQWGILGGLNTILAPNPGPAPTTSTGIFG